MFIRLVFMLFPRLLEMKASLLCIMGKLFINFMLMEHNNNRPILACIARVCACNIAC